VEDAEILAFLCFNKPILRIITVTCLIFQVKMCEIFFFKENLHKQDTTNVLYLGILFSTCQGLMEFGDLSVSTHTDQFILTAAC
jgi:hypothetical protein